MILAFLIEKEFKQFLRNPFLPKLVLVFPVMMMLLLPWAANLEVKNIHLVVVDNDHSSTSRQLVDKLASSGYFLLDNTVSSYGEAMRMIEEGGTDVIVEIPLHFEKRRMRGEEVNLLVAANAVNGTKGALGGSYLTTILSEYTGGTPSVQIESLNLFNPNLSYKYFIVPALVVMLLTLLCGFLPALNIVSEKEFGTIEQINVTPVGKLTFILAKLLPYWLIGVLVLTNCLLLAWLLYGITPAGNLWLVYFFAALFILGISGFGLVISNHSSTMQQAMFVMFFFLIILMLMSGLFTPIASMPRWAQAVTLFNPLRYMMQVMRMVYLKGSTFSELLPQLWALIAFALFFNGWAVWSYRKRG